MPGRSSSGSADAIPMATSGVSAKQQAKLHASGRSARVALDRSAGVSVSPIENMSSESPTEKDRAEPSAAQLPEKASPSEAAAIVSTGKHWLTSRSGALLPVVHTGVAHRFVLGTRQASTRSQLRGRATLRRSARAAAGGGPPACRAVAGPPACRAIVAASSTGISILQYAVLW